MTNNPIAMKGTLNCPVCGFRKARVYRRLANFGETKKWIFFIECAHCGTSSCRYGSDDIAIGAWDSKTDPRLMRVLYPDMPEEDYPA